MKRTMQVLALVAVLALLTPSVFADNATAGCLQGETHAPAHGDAYFVGDAYDFRWWPLAAGCWNGSLQSAAWHNTVDVDKYILFHHNSSLLMVRVKALDGCVHSNILAPNDQLCESEGWAIIGLINHPEPFKLSFWGPNGNGTYFFAFA